MDTVCHNAARAAERRGMETKKRKRTKIRVAGSRTVRVPEDQYRDLTIIAREMDRSRTWVLSQAIAAYAVTADLAKAVKPRLEVRA